MKNPFKANSIQDYLAALILIAVFFTGVIIFYNVSNKTKNEVAVVKPPECDKSFVEYQKLIEKGQSVLLSSNQNSFAVDGKFIGSKVVVTRRQGEIVCGYLYVAASKGGVMLDEQYDSIYVNPQGLGGHILRSRSLELPDINKSPTKALFSLDSIPYLPNVPYNPKSQNFDIADWAKLINASSKTEFIIALSTTNPSGKINEIRIAYKCWDPSTGKETNDCQLGLE